MLTIDSRGENKRPTNLSLVFGEDFSKTVLCELQAARYQIIQIQFGFLEELLLLHCKQLTKTDKSQQKLYIFKINRSIYAHFGIVNYSKCLFRSNQIDFISNQKLVQQSITVSVGYKAPFKKYQTILLENHVYNQSSHQNCIRLKNVFRCVGKTLNL